jgi:parallel beta-helix repeat protein
MAGPLLADAGRRRDADLSGRVTQMTPIGRRRLVFLLGVLILGATAVALRFALFAPERVPRDAIAVPRDVATLHEALRRVKPGGTIVLDAKGGPIAGPVAVDVPGITIRSFGAPAHIDAEGGAPTLAVRADDVTLSNLTISGGSVGVFVSAARCRVEDLTVRGAAVAVRLLNARDGHLGRVVVEGASVGVELSSSSGSDVRSVTVRDAAETAVRVVGSWDNALRQLVVARAAVGIALEDGSRDTVVAGCRIDDCGGSGVIVRGSSGVRLTDILLRGVGVGVVLDRATGCEIVSCTVERPADAGIVLEESLQSRVLDTTITAPGTVGIRLTRSANNTLSGNEIRGGSGTAVLLVASDRNLVERNEVADAPVGLRVDGASSCRILRNVIAARDLGLILEGGGDHRVLDNRVTGGTLGIACVSSAGNRLLRNRLLEQQGSALSLLSGSTASTLAKNRASRSGVGILVAASSHSDVLDNSVVRNDIGVLLLRTGPGLRLEANRLEANAVGLEQIVSSADLPPPLATLGAYFGAPGGEAAAPVVANNLFRGSRVLDIRNGTDLPLYAAGNRWGAGADASGASSAAVSSNVRLQESAWKGTVAIGADASGLQTLVGHILRAALARAGYRVVNLIGIGTAELVREAVDVGDADLGYLNSTVAGSPAPEGGATILPLPARIQCVAVVPQRIADELAEPSLSALSVLFAGGGDRLLWVIPSEYGEPAVLALRTAYGFARQVHAVVWAKTPDEAESLLTLGAAQFALLGSLEETVTSSGFVVLEDGLHVLPFQDVAAVARNQLLRTHPDIEDVLARLLPRLTSSTLRELLLRVRLSDQSPEVVAAEFVASLESKSE